MNKNDFQIIGSKGKSSATVILGIGNILIILNTLG
jgi:hypothetical protein